MWNRAFSFLLFLSVICCLHASNYQRRFFRRQVAESKDFKQEKECSKVGGICLAREECPSDKISADGSCPTQSQAGAVCCHSLSIKETRCHRLGGACMVKCNDNLKKPQATDCPASQFCCVLV